MLDKLHAHTSRLIEDVGLDRNVIESEGLGLRPISSAEDFDKSRLKVIGRRYYRLAQWTAVLQGSDWVNVSHPCFGEDISSRLYRMRTRKHSGITLWLTNLTIYGAYARE